MRRASELRAILGIKRCMALLCQKSNEYQNEIPLRVKIDGRLPSNLRPEAREWTPGNQITNPVRSGNDNSRFTPPLALGFVRSPHPYLRHDFSDPFRLDI